MAAALLDLDPRVGGAAVAVRKLRPPVAEDVGSVGVRVVRAGAPRPSQPGGEPPVRRAFVGLGSNLGDRLAHLERAVELLAGRRRRGGGLAGLRDRAGRRARAGPVPERRRRAVDGRLGRGGCSSAAGPSRSDAARVRTVRFGPRTLDADVLLVGDERVDEPDLVVPHPRMCERRFVLAPLADLAPELVDRRRWTRLSARSGAWRTLTRFTTPVTKPDR